jgi:hypothetical protein
MLREAQGCVTFPKLFFFFFFFFSLCFFFCFLELNSLKATMETKLMELERMSSVLRTARIDIGDAQGGG